MRIYRRDGSKVWWYYWRGRRGSTGFTDETAAERWFTEFQRRAADPTYRAPDPSATLAAELEGFIAFKRNNAKRKRAPGTIAMYELHARGLCQVLGAETPIASLTLADVERYVAVRTAEGASASTRWKEWCTLRGTLKRARKHGRFPRAIDEVTPDDMQPTYVPLTRHLLLPDVMRLLAELPSKRRAVVAFIVAFGADLGCIERAQPGDVAGGLAHVRGSKTTHRDRVVPVLPCFEALAEEAAAGIPFEPWASMRRDLMRAATRAGVGPMARDGLGRHITARDLRRSHGRILRAAGVEPALIGSMLGHAPGSPVTALAYAQLQPAELGALIEGRMAATAAAAARTDLAQSKARKPKKAGKRRAA